MADLVFDRMLKTLSWPSKGLRWGAISGPYGKGSLPSGLYDVGRREVTGYTSAVDSPYRDKTGKGFFVPVYAKFETNRGKKDGRLGIHPDGNVPGTLGCIGITNANARNFHDAIRSTAPSAVLILKVI